MNENFGWLVPVLATGTGLLVGFLVCQGQTRRAAKQRQLIPEYWPLYSRAIANPEEDKVWRWLRNVFHDHHIMIKMPVTRFMMPCSGENGRHWNTVLSGVYSTFSVCATDGHVVGCVDVVNVANFAKKNRRMKLTLLSQFGIAYKTLNSDNLPTLAQIRCEFLGETKPTPPQEPESNEMSFTKARENLQAVVDYQRIDRCIEMSALIPYPGTTFATKPNVEPPPDSEFGCGSSWQQQDSFIAPLER